MMRFLSLFSGIEAASVAWAPFGWECVGVAEIEPFPCELLKQHSPNTPNLGDVSKITDAQIAALGRIDLVVGGSPCQDLSVAGKRAGLAGARSGLFHQQMRIFNAARTFCGARWLLWENVPGAFSSNAGRDFAVLVSEMAGCKLTVPVGGWGSEGVALGQRGLVEWAVLDAQWFGVAQRRRRVFALLDTGDWTNRRPILLEQDSLRGDSPPVRETREETPAGTLRGTDGGVDVDRHVVTMAHGQGGAEIASDRAPTLTCNHEAPIAFLPETAHTLRGEGFDASEDGTGRGTPLVAIPLLEVGKRTGVSTTDPRAGIGIGKEGDPMFTLQAGAQHGVAVGVALRGRDGGGDKPHVMAPVPFRKVRRASSAEDAETWEQAEAANTLNCFDVGDVRATTIALTTEQTPKFNYDVAFTLPKQSPTGGGQPQCVAFNRNAQPAQMNCNEDTTPALTCSQGADSGPLPGMRVRRLTPRECERLQGFPMTWDSIMLTVCLDRRNRSAHVELQCRKWLSNALPAAGNGSFQGAGLAAESSSMHQVGREPLAAVVVHTNSEDALHEIRSRGRLLWSADGAMAANSSRLPIPAANIARAAALLWRALANEIRDGKVELLLSMMPSTAARNGSEPAGGSGQGILGCAVSASGDQSKDMFTTSSLALLRQTCDSRIATLCCSAFRVIAGCIPDETLPDSFSVELTVGSPYTLIPWRGKPAEQCPDGPRYKALGNSMAVPVMEWIGARIVMHLEGVI